METFKLCGMDECGRGALAGPLVAGAVTIGMDHIELLAKSPAPIRDSKLLTRLQRERLVDYFNQISIKFEIVTIGVEEINQYNIGWANKEAFWLLSQKLKADHYIADGNLKLKIKNCESLVKADQTILEVSIASIIAKVHRDSLMTQLHQEFPLYGWNHNVGYGTLYHRQALLKHGSCLHHRHKFIDSIVGCQ